MFSRDKLETGGLVHFDGAEKRMALVVPTQRLIEYELIVEPDDSPATAEMMQNLDLQFGRCGFHGLHLLVFLHRYNLSDDRGAALPSFCHFRGRRHRTRR